LIVRLLRHKSSFSRLTLTNFSFRMESTGQRGKIQISQDTADLLVAAGKMSWIAPREERVVAKGKGEMQTFWVNIGTTIDVSAFQDGMGSLDDSLSYEEGPFSTLSPKTTRLVLWNVEILLDMLRQIHVLRGKTTSTFREIIVRSEERHTTAYDEVEDVIQFPPYNGQAAEIDTDGVEIKPEVEQQLEDFISTIASMYIENPFHDFAHASHATMGVVKLLSSLVKAKPGEYSDVQNASYLIASNPLVQFAMVLSVICHDVDHPGASNAILLSEKSRMASVYGYKSVAEQNSLDLTWDLLMDDNYAELRAAIYRTEEEKQLFRQVLVNSVISTDLFDQRLKDRFESRWKVGFPNESHGDQGTSKNLQATLIMETMVQAADIAHTMQHWQVYRKWNLRLFEEMYQGFVDGRTSSDPSDFWFEGELQFYNNYTLPLVRRLRQSGAFVTASTDSHQDYAEQNKRQWENKGKDIVAEMVDATRAKITARMKEGPHGLDE